MYTLNQLAEAVGAEVLGAGSTELTGVAPFEVAGPCQITLAQDAGYVERLASTQASAVIVAANVESGEKPLLRSANPKLAFARIVALFYPSENPVTGISEHAVVGEDCRIDDRVSIHPFVVIGDNVRIGKGAVLYPGVSVAAGCVIGEGTTLYPNVTLYAGVRVGARVSIHSSSVIGADGFGYVSDGQQQVKIPQTGEVEIHDDVEIGANTCIDRATFGKTVIERGVKIDNLVQIGHNCRIGAATVICGGVGISGSVTVGKNCVLAGGAGVRDHVVIGDNVTVLGKTGVDKDIPAGRMVSGYVQREHRVDLKIQGLIQQLPRLYEQLKTLRKRVNELEDGSGQGKPR